MGDKKACHVASLNQALRAMAFNLINIQEQQVYQDKRKISIIKNLKEKVVLLSPDKGNGVVIAPLRQLQPALVPITLGQLQSALRPINSK